MKHLLVLCKRIFFNITIWICNKTDGPVKKSELRNSPDRVLSLCFGHKLNKYHQAANFPPDVAL